MNTGFTTRRRIEKRHERCLHSGEQRWQRRPSISNHSATRKMRRNMDERFGRLLVIGQWQAENGEQMRLCRCDCGKEVTTRRAYLIKGKKKSCGCLSRELAAARCAARTTHGHARGGVETPTYRTWHSMVSRCTSKSHSAYYKYGARGITVCERWLRFEHFLADMGERPIGTTIDRIDGTKGYELANCRWATPKQQANNVSSNLVIEANGKRQTASAWSRDTGIPMYQLHRRIKAGWSQERTVNEPLAPRPPRKVRS